MIILIVTALAVAMLGAVISTTCDATELMLPIFLLGIAIGIASFTWFGAKICPTCERVTKDSYCKNCGTENVCYFCYEEDVPDGE